MIILNLLNRIFGRKANLSRGDISSYLKGEGDRHDIEAKSLADDFNSDALEGWEESNLSLREVMEGLDQKMDKNLNSRKWSFGSVTFFALFFLTSGLLLVFTYTGNQDVRENEEMIFLTEDSYPGTEQTEERILNTTSEKEIDQLKTVSKDKEIDPKSLQVHEKSHKIKNTSGQKPNDVAIKTSPEPDPVLEPNVTSSIPVNSGQENLKYGFSDEIYLHQFKLIDYRSYRNAPIKNSRTLTIGTPASMAHKSDEGTEELTETKDIPYIDYIDNAMAYFERSDYKKALKRYLIILETYPKDMNAHFYSGLCYYNLGSYEKAINHLEKSYDLKFGNFREEALWFKAKALLETGKKKEAESLLKKITEEKMFYATQAEEMLKTL
ncbi:MAG: tetratricopeptide repeat protein [Brumimicrobium sp.]|nr:tetratricopeptide repeat protein [Brumimicrobium sp.]